MHTVYSVGYTGFPHAQLVDAVTARDMIVADVRLKPVSRFQPHWNRQRLADTLGARYQWIEALGNLNYKTGGVALKDEAAGLDAVRQLLETHDVAILCACQDPATCHRTVIVERLAMEGYPFALLRPGPVGPVGRGGMLRLFV